MSTGLPLYPTLMSDRLRLVSPAEPGFNTDARFLSETAPKFIDAADDPDALWWSMASIIGHWHLRGYGMFAVLERKTDEVVGMVGPWYPQGWPEPELSWHLVESAHGKGYAVEAANCVLDWLFHDQKWDTIVSLIADENEGSIALAKRLGAKPEEPFFHHMVKEVRIWRHQPNPGSIWAAGDPEKVQ